MVDSFAALIMVGTVLGFMAGLGIGGGSLLILWLTFIAGESLEAARSINLLFFLPAAVIACIFRRRQHQLRLKALYPAMLSGCLSAAAVAWATANLDLAVVRKLFGILLVGIGLKEVFYRPRKAR